MITKTNLSVTEAAETLTGFDEDFIADKCGGRVIEQVLVEHSRVALRVLAACLVAREGDGDREKAYEHVQGLSMKQVNDFFAEDEDEAMPDEPDTESGKDDSSDD